MLSASSRHISLLVFTSLALLVSAISPFDRLTWLLEIAPVLIALPVLIWTYPRYQLTDLLYILVTVHALILIVGGVYTYARVPLGFYLQDWLHLSRNPYDKIGHFAQGFVPAIITREILIRAPYGLGKKMRIFLCISVVMMISASYELLEWISALILGQGADAFLGMQGDVWDTQSDMFFALIGAMTALSCLYKIHDQQVQKLSQNLSTI